ncbi:pyridoxal-phosphate-dependent aminotransferase family protein [Halegenticoccus tardaugens]|uniref:pyridoxal-phosphate-dependent aminotransferase family protein n=1 Tax=Halegenticoccus tardaugens TaxID=2071624 RepID=UPI00100B1D10|nr:aminotransferase class V-fold PLP-dependent enzyme [Halegenticoccus tardaugens]
MLMTPGPTAVPRRVREAMSEAMPNPDVEEAFAERYEDVTRKLATVYGTDDDLVVLGGEGILGLEAAVASIVEPGDRVLCLSNGLYGDGFADFVESYGGEATLVGSEYADPLDVERVEEALDEADADGSEFEAATMVHCETPTGTLNEIGDVLELLQDRGVLTIIDAVSSLGGAPVPTAHVDVCLGASQKCFSAPPGLSTVSVSDAVWDAVEARDPETLYTNLLPWRDVSDGFPYTHLSANVAALDAALDLLLEEGLDAAYARHEAAAERCRERGRALGLVLYPDRERSSPTVTAFHVPGRATELQRRLDEDHDVVVATGLGELADDILRVGHMGFNADVERVERTMDALGAVLDAA